MLAVQRRGVDAVDVDTGESLFVPLTVYLHPTEGIGDDDQSGQRHSNNEENVVDQDGNGQPDKELSSAQAAPLQQSTRANSDPHLRGVTARERPAVDARAQGAERAVALVTPCVLPDLSKVSRVSIRSARYFPVELDLTDDPAVAAALRRHCKIYVKRRVGHLSYKNVRKDKRSEECVPSHESTELLLSGSVVKWLGCSGMLQLVLDSKIVRATTERTPDGVHVDPLL